MYAWRPSSAATTRPVRSGQMCSARATIAKRIAGARLASAVERRDVDPLAG
jgi:hypothetical protein